MTPTTVNRDRANHKKTYITDYVNVIKEHPGLKTTLQHIQSHVVTHCTVLFASEAHTLPPYSCIS